ncbi:ATP-binding protein [Pseudobacteriovorax antillogorgiicola]|uniref:histidine kinase n=1 Tax=Pseudobacteriovorax antillogorgiicola TaxID=1513793 RepID=A0A1Y6BVT3_9BACT|nr:ATP-binding protein [Pseudobacteriovorax antillogorgiicola]TCS53749.1 signal transduction histidine kinase [Pseudobacteriovorax antillogorgiicola]SMF22612.1 Signal transduction histidine kinase [Pseudobacteriovorax antillogorgiicola]
MKPIGKPERVLTTGYMATLVVIALLTGVSTLFQVRYISVEENAADAVANIAQQQIRVQEMALVVNRLSNTILDSYTDEDRQRLLHLADVLEEKHQHLMKKFEADSVFLWDITDSTLLSQGDVETYTRLEVLIGKYLQNTRYIANAGDRVTDLDELLIEIESLSRSILTSFETILGTYASEREEKVRSYLDFQIMGFFFVVGVLLLVGMFVFRPIANHIRQFRLDLEKSQREAERASNIKTDFLTNISHEIRTPLSGILGFTDILLSDSDCTGERRDHVFSIKRSAKHLKTLIDDLLDLSKVESGKIEINLEEVNLMRVLHEVVSIVEVKMKDKGLDFRTQFQSEIPEHVISDGIRVTQVLVNILGNAAKFTDEGRVLLQVSAAQKDNTATQLRFTIVDTGCGIPPDKTKKLFKRFSQVHSSLVQKTEGTGLGLALSKHLAKLLKGDLVLVNSRPGMGSTFQFTVPCEVPVGTKTVSEFSPMEDDPDDVVEAETFQGFLEGVKVLLVEDGHDNQRIYNYFLKLSGATVISCWDGEAGLEQATNNSDIDIILMDIQLPKIDGYTATNELRVRGIKTPIIALTAHAMREEKERCLRSGFSAYVSKPVSIPSLMRTIRSTLRKKTPMKKETQSPVIRSKYHDREVYRPMIIEFIDTLSCRVEELQSAYDGEDWLQLQKLAHKLKGAGSTYGFTDISRLTETIESRSKEMGDSSENSEERSILGNVLKQLSQVCEQVKQGGEDLKENSSKA